MKNRMGDRMKNKGFTLIELLAVLAILGVIMLIAVPSIQSIILKNKQNSYAEDAKQLIAEAEYKLRVDTSMNKPTSGSKIVIPLSCVNGSELSKGPEGYAYDPDYTYVVVDNIGGTLKYSAQIAERKTKGEGSDQRLMGLSLISKENLNKGEGPNFYTNDGAASKEHPMKSKGAYLLASSCFN